MKTEIIPNYNFFFCYVYLSFIEAIIVCDDLQKFFFLIHNKDCKMYI